MTTYRLNIVYAGIDFDDDDVLEAVAELPSIVWRAQGTVAVALAVVEAMSALEAAKLVTHLVTERVPSARPVRLDEDLVAIPDIAGRVGVTREAVRNWANGTRHANFPLSSGVVGDGIKVWRWADVNRWLQANLNLGDSEEFPSSQDAVLINTVISGTVRRRSVAAAAGATWNVASTVHTSTKTRAPRHAERSWVEAGTKHEHAQFSVVDGDSYAAA